MADQSLKDVIEKLNAENASRPFAEFPKMLHHPDGRQATVNDSRAESDLTGNGWCLTPTQALKEREIRDEAARKRDLEAAQDAGDEEKGARKRK